MSDLIIVLALVTAMAAMFTKVIEFKLAWDKRKSEASKPAASKAISKPIQNGFKRWYLVAALIANFVSLVVFIGLVWWCVSAFSSEGAALPVSVAEFRTGLVLAVVAIIAAVQANGHLSS